MLASVTVKLNVLSHTVVVSSCGLSLNDILPQKLCDLLSLSDRLCVFFGAGLEVTVVLEVPANFNASVGEDVGIAYGLVSCAAIDQGYVCVD